MTTYTAVTTFSREGFEAYGRRFIETFLDNWSIPLLVYHESQPDTPILHERLTWRNLDHDVDRTEFIGKHGSDPMKVGTSREPNSQAIRFCHKVFAITHAGLEHHPDGIYPEWVFWIDADVETKRKVTQHDLDSIMPPEKDLSFLGRPRYLYTECGFVGYRISDLNVRHMLRDMRSYYTSGEIFTRARCDWHDSRCFDICRERSVIEASRQYSLSAEGGHSIHVWPTSPLGRFSEHHKGPGRKQRAYGAIVP